MSMEEKGRTLYEIDKNIEALVNTVDPDTGEIIVDNDMLDALLMERDAKIENIACYIKNLTADAKALKEEEAALSARRKTTEKKVERLKDYLTYALQGEKFQTAKCAVSFRKSSAVEVDDCFVEWAQTSGNEELLRYKEPEVNKTAVKERLTGGEAFDFARLVQNTSITIK